MGVTQTDRRLFRRDPERSSTENFFVRASGLIAA